MKYDRQMRDKCYRRFATSQPNVTECEVTRNPNLSHLTNRNRARLDTTVELPERNWNIYTNHWRHYNVKSEPLVFNSTAKYQFLFETLPPFNSFLRHSTLTTFLSKQDIPIHELVLRTITASSLSYRDTLSMLLSGYTCYYRDTTAVGCFNWFWSYQLDRFFEREREKIQQ